MNWTSDAPPPGVSADSWDAWQRQAPQDFLTAWMDAQRAAERTRDDTRRRVHTDPVAHAVASMVVQVLARHEAFPESGGWPFSAEERERAFLDMVGTVLGLIDMAREGRI